MNGAIEAITTSGVFRDIDIHLAEFLAAKSSAHLPGRDLLKLVIMLLSARLNSGDVCLSLGQIAGMKLSVLLGLDDSSVEGVVLPDEDSLVSEVMASGVAGGADDMLPLVLDAGNKLYFHKYFVFEKSLAETLARFAAAKSSGTEIDGVREIFHMMFPGSGDETDWQGAAAYLALAGGLTVITGGPGTGKTSTVVRILALAAASAAAGGGNINIVLAAPTGKAAARLRESVNEAVSSLPVPDAVKGMVPSETFTIHRLLGYIRDSHQFRHNRENPLPFDLVVVDECSMGDMALMYRLAEAVKPGARLILLGDRDQLSSVEGGSVFGDICGASDGIYSDDFVTGAHRLCGLKLPGGTASKSTMNNSVVTLTKSWRFGESSGIGRFAELVRRGDAEGALSLIESGEYPDIRLAKCSSAGDIRDLYRDAVSGITGAVGAPLTERIAGLVSGFTILTALRRGEFGAEGMNSMAEEVLYSLGVITPRGRFYPGRPVIVSANDYQLGLFNGDIGITSDTADLVIFRSPDGGSIKVHPSRLPGHETAFAMTIHKSQGSEFDSVLVVLPPVRSAVLSRELLYTAVTRARKQVLIVSDDEILKWMINAPTVRMSGLKMRLKGVT